MSVRNVQSWVAVAREAQDDCPCCKGAVSLFTSEALCYQYWHEGLERWLVVCQSREGKIRQKESDWNNVEAIKTQSSEVNRPMLARAGARYVQ